MLLHVAARRVRIGDHVSDLVSCRSDRKSRRRVPESADFSFGLQQLLFLKFSEELETVRLSEFESSLKRLGVSFDSPKVGLPLRHVEVPLRPLWPVRLTPAFR